MKKQLFFTLILSFTLSMRANPEKDALILNIQAVQAILAKSHTLEELPAIKNCFNSIAQEAQEKGFDDLKKEAERLALQTQSRITLLYLSTNAPKRTQATTTKPPLMSTAVLEQARSNLSKNPN